MRLRFLMIGLLVLVSGCKGSRYAPVSGRVTMGDKPLVNATVTFYPISDEKEPGPGSQGKTDADGRFTLETMTGNIKGAVIGPHRVTITAYEGDNDEVPSSGSDMKFRKELTGEDYRGPNSTLKFDVPSEGATNANFDLPAPKK